MTKVPKRFVHTAARPEAHVPLTDTRELIASLPHLPGVYRMFDANGGALYVGKARDLKKRVSNYFQKSEHEARIAAIAAAPIRIHLSNSPRIAVRRTASLRSPMRA